jgi:hypothetical protein
VAAWATGLRTGGRFIGRFFFLAIGLGLAGAGEVGAAASTLCSGARGSGAKGTVCGNMLSLYLEYTEAARAGRLAEFSAEMENEGDN